MENIYYNPPYCEEDECGGGSDPDWSNIQAESISFVATDGDFDGTAEAGNSSRISVVGGGSVETNDGGVVIQGDDLTVITNTSVSISSESVDLGSTILTTVHSNTESNLFVDGGAGVYATSADNRVLLASPVEDGLVDIQANGDNGSVTISATGTGGSIDLSADTVTVNGSPIGGGGIPEVWIGPSTFAGNATGFVSPGGAGVLAAFAFGAGLNTFGISETLIPDGWTDFTVEYFVSSADANNAHSFVFESSYQLVGAGTILDGEEVAFPVSFLNTGGDNGVTVSAPAAISNPGNAKVLNFKVRSNNATQEINTEVRLLGILLRNAS